MKYTIGIDIGTSHIKIMAMNATGEILFKEQLETLTTHALPNTAEQNPDILLQQVIQLLTIVSQKMVEKPAAITFSSGMHSLMAVDTEGYPLTEVLIWADNRAEFYAQKLKNTPRGKALFQHTGTPIHAMSPLVKIAWIRDNQPDIFKKTAWFCGIKEYIFFKLFDTRIIDLSLASATGLMHTIDTIWHKPALKYASITVKQLSKIVSPYHVETLKNNTYFPNWDDVPFVIGASDGCLSNLASGATDAQMTTITMGTSGAVRRMYAVETTSITREKDLKQAFLFTYRLDEDHFVVGGPTNNGGIVLEWLSENLFKQDISTILQAAQAVEIGSNDLIFLPYILGERAPLWDSTARGAFLNIAFAHTQAHFIRATMEGILFNIQNIHQSIDRKSVV